MSHVADHRTAHPGWVWQAVGAVKTLVIGALLCTNPLTAILVLGWLTRRMAATVERRFGGDADAPGWLLGQRGHGAATRFLGGLAANIRTGFGTLAALLLLTLPFTAIWLGAWWAGWENSFNKGYEQAWIGPVVFTLGLLVSLPLLSFLPIALAHAAAERRWWAAFEIRRLRLVRAYAGWRIPTLAALTLVLTLPLFAARGLPAFAGNIAPNLENLPPEAVAEIAGRIDLVEAIYVFVTLLILRTLAARLYARAAALAAGADPALWARSRARQAAAFGRKPMRIMQWLWLAASLILWLGFAILILVAQFLNYGWWHWLTHPYVLLPWAG